MNEAQVKESILRTLLYYDIFSHPLKPEEVFMFLPTNSVPHSDMLGMIKRFSQEADSTFAEKDGYVYVKPNEHYIQLRKDKEKCSRRMWRAARFMTHLIKRFPFVRAVFISGSLSKNSSEEISDIDFMIVTKPGRLWISRTLLILFKKIFLLNSYKYFCLNYFITEDNLEIPFKNVFTATEVAYIKATFNTELMNKFVMTNSWIKEYFPNYKFLDPYLHSAGFKVNNRKSHLQKILELPFLPKFVDKLEDYFRIRTGRHWNNKYSSVDQQERNIMFRTASNESTAHPGNMQKTVLAKYCEKLKQFNLECDGDV